MRIIYFLNYNKKRALGLSLLSFTMTDILSTNPLPLPFPDPPTSCPFPNSFQFNPFFPKPINKSVSAALSSSSNGRTSKPSRGYTFYNQLQFHDTKLQNFGLDRNHNHIDEEDSPIEKGFDGLDGDDEGRRNSQEEDLVPIQQGDDDLEKDEKFSSKVGFRKVKQIIRRSNLLAKQVISIRSALSLGFVSQLWVDTTSVSLKYCIIQIQ